MSERFVALLRDAVWDLEHLIEDVPDSAPGLEQVADAIDVGDTHEMIFELIRAWPNQQAAEVVLDAIEQATGKRGYPGEVIP